MTYIQNRKKNFGSHAIFIGIVVGVLALLMIIWPHFFPSLFTSFVSPFWRGQAMIAMGSLDTREKLLADNERLRRELMEAQLDVASVQALESENQELKTLLDRNQISTSSLALGAVLKRPPSVPFDEIIIDLGSAQGIKSGAYVYAPGEVLIGTVKDVSSQTSKVILFTSPGETHEVFIGREKAVATAKGRGGGQFVAELPRDVTVKEGDVVIESNKTNRAFGIVSSVLNDPVQPFELIYFAPPVNIFELRWVFVSKE